MKHEKLPIGSAEYINQLNKIKILNLIWEKGEISRAEVVKITGISAPTVTRIVDSLIKKEKLAESVGIGESSGGRPPMIVRFDGTNHFVVGLDWGRTHIQGIIANLNAEVVVEMDFQTEPDNNFDNELKKVVDLIDQLIKRSKIDKKKISGIGIAAAGFVNHKTGLVEFSPNFKWKDADIVTKISKTFKVPVIVDNVSRIMALGELWFGAGKMIQDFIFVNIGYGIGAGIIVDGKPFYGFDGFSGEIGHVKVENEDVDKTQCVCGKFNCLENYASGRGIAEIAKKGIGLHPGSSINKLCKNDPNTITAEIVAKAAAGNDGFAVKVITKAAHYIAVSISCLANVFNPQMVIIGGKVPLGSIVYLKETIDTFHKELLPNTHRKIEIVTSELKDYSAAKGAIALILKEVIKLKY